MAAKKKHPVRDRVPAKSKPSPAALDEQAQKQQQQPPPPPAATSGKKEGEYQDPVSLHVIKREVRELRALDGRLSALAKESDGLNGHESKVKSPAAMPSTTASDCPVHSQAGGGPVTTSSPSESSVQANDDKSESGNSEIWNAEDDERQLETMQAYLRDISDFTIRERKTCEAILIAQSIRRSPYHPIQPFTACRAYFLDWVVREQPHLSFSTPRQAYIFLCKHVWRCKPIPGMICGPVLDEERTWHYKRNGEERGKRLKGARFEGFWGLGGDEVVLMSFGEPDWKGDRYVYAYLKAWFSESARERMKRMVRVARSVAVDGWSVEGSADESGGAAGEEADGEARGEGAGQEEAAEADRRVPP